MASQESFISLIKAPFRKYLKIFENIQEGTLPDRCLQDWLLVRFGEFLLLLLLMLLLGAVALAVAVAVAVAVADTFRMGGGSRKL